MRLGKNQLAPQSGAAQVEQFPWFAVAFALLGFLAVAFCALMQFWN